MESVASIMDELKRMGSAQTIKTFANHGAPIDSMFGVKVGDLKTIVKRVKKNYELAKGLYDTGNSDAMYLAGLIGDETKMTKADLNKWAKNSTWQMISEYAVPFVAAENKYGWELALEWIQSDKENIASCGWSTLSLLVATVPDDQLDIKTIMTLVKGIPKKIHTAPNRVRYTMNGFVISVGCYIDGCYNLALDTADKIGKVEVFMGKTACKVPEIKGYLKKIETMGKLGQKRKNARC